MRWVSGEAEDDTKANAKAGPDYKLVILDASGKYCY